MEMRLCAGCDHKYRDQDLAPFQRNQDGTFAEACRSCISAWIKLGALYNDLPFWRRKEGHDRPGETYGSS